jgi:hypothetical protein
MNQPLKLTDGQQGALDAFVEFLMNPVKTYFVLEGYAGTGKSTLVRELLDRLPSFMEELHKKHPDSPEYQIALTATTNKAAEVLSTMSGMDVGTIHSFLGLRVSTDYKTNITKLIPTSPDKQYYYLLFIDEASFVDHDLLKHIRNRTEHCKIVFMGDRGQLAPVKCSGVPPVFTQGFEGAMLTEVMRQMVDGVPKANPITELATAFREVVKGESWPNIKKFTGEYIKVLPETEFLEVIMKEFTREDWRYVDSKVLGWTNACVIDYNKIIGEQVSGTPHLEIGDYAVNNKAIVLGGGKGIRTDELVQITHIEEDTEHYGCPGNWIIVNHVTKLFFPKSLADRKEAFNRAKERNYYGCMREIDMEWIDLRHAFAQTVNKSQGSTYDRVYIDLEDIWRCTNGEQVARMLYVAVSRARYEIIFKKVKS